MSRPQSNPPVKGMQDILPPDVTAWQRIEDAARAVFGPAGFDELRTPVLEYTQVFTRSIGEVSDIVEKEMYTFDDKGGRSVTMRPEGTAGLVRAFVHNNLAGRPVPQKYFYMGPMFRYERPQKGRLRQFHQIGAEAFGLSGAHLDADLIAVLMEFLTRAGIGGLTLEVNSIGCPECRPGFRAALVGFFEARRAALCEDCGRRLTQNPLRILDCKAKTCIEARAGAPSMADHICQGCREHFGGLRAALDSLGIAYSVNPELVRGLDYYTRTTFEVKTTRLGAQSAVAAGGRYDGLVAESGGPSTPAVGFAAGMERLAALLMEDSAPQQTGARVFIVSLGADATRTALAIARDLRALGVRTELGYGEGSMKSQMRRADRSGARHVLMIGSDELTARKAVCKDMRGGQAQVEIPLDGIAGTLKGMVSSSE